MGIRYVALPMGRKARIHVVTSLQAIRAYTSHQHRIQDICQMLHGFRLQLSGNRPFRSLTPGEPLRGRFAIRFAQKCNRCITASPGGQHIFTMRCGISLGARCARTQTASSGPGTVSRGRLRTAHRPWPVLRDVEKTRKVNRIEVELQWYQT